MYMYEQENTKTIHLMTLLCYSVFTIAVIIGALLLGWETAAVVLLIAGLILSWTMHITEILSESVRLWLYAALTILSFFFYGIHDTSLYDMTPVAVFLILLYTAAEKHSFVRIFAVTYYLTLAYDFGAVYDKLTESDSKIAVIRLIFHLAVVLVAERLAEMIINMRRRNRKKTEEKIRELEEFNQRTEDFMANTSHELRTPINAVTGITAVMLKSEEDPEKLKDLLSIQRAGNRLFNQIEDILDYTEVEAGSIIISEENYMITSIINDIITEARTRMIRARGMTGAGAKRLHLVYDVDYKIPAVLYGDGRKVKKILKHLIDNAVKFTKTGGAYVRVYSLHKSYGVNLCIKISDTGVGITEEVLGKIKDKFFQSDGGRNRTYGGLGLGIPIVHGMVTAMGGFMQIESTEGKGTTVSVSIPQKVIDPAPCMVLKDPDSLCVAVYIRMEKFEHPEVRDYFGRLISHIVHGLGVTMHRVFNMEELKRLVSVYRLTHLFVGVEEYNEDPAFIDSIDKSVDVMVSTYEDVKNSKNNRIKFIRRPYYGLSIVNVLNSRGPQNYDLAEEMNFICPGVKVLVVDDEPMNLMVAEGIFRDYKMEVKIAGSGMDAIDICKHNDFDLIFLDHMMPGMDGIETLKRLRKTMTDTVKSPVMIAFTANVVSGAREMFLEEGFNEFISKPIEDLELKRLLKKVLPKSAIEYVDEDDLSRSAPENSEGNYEAAGTETKEAAPGNDSMALLREHGFNTEAGLQYCRGDAAFYETLLTKFVNDSEKKMTDIEVAFKNEDIKNYQIMVHALKSSSKMIGMDVLSEMARLLEEAAKNQNIAYIKENHSSLIDKYYEKIRCIMDSLGLAEPSEAEDETVSGEEIPKDDLLKHLSDLRQALDTSESNTVESLIGELDKYVYDGKSVSSLLKDIKQDVDDFEWGSASERTEALIGSLKGGEG